MSSVAVNGNGATSIRMGCEKGEKVSPLEWGIPGKLTEKEVEVYNKFRDVVESRGGEFRKTVYSFGEEEGEPYTLCRWLRARKFDFDQVVTMVEQATEERSGPKENDFYPDPKAALMVEKHVYVSQYPQFYFGNGKNGVPVFYSQAGRVNMKGLECLTTFDSILKYHWFEMIHNFATRLRNNKMENDSFTDYACITVMDLDGLSVGSLSGRTLALIKEQIKIDSLCFPETLNRMVIVNAPRFFAATWSLIKGWLDPRTANKIEIISSQKATEKRLKELIEPDQIPKDYGGTGPSVNSLFSKDATGDMKRYSTELLSVRSSASAVFELREGEKMDVVVYTKGKTGAFFSVTDAITKAVISANTAVTFSGDAENDPAAEVVVASSILGPGKFKVKANTKSKSMARTSYDNFLVVFNVFSS